MELNEARELVTTLADGTDPMTGELLPAESPYNQPIIIRALFTMLGSSNKQPTKKSL